MCAKDTCWQTLMMPGILPCCSSLSFRDTTKTDACGTIVGRTTSKVEKTRDKRKRTQAVYKNASIQLKDRWTGTHPSPSRPRLPDRLRNKMTSSIGDPLLSIFKYDAISGLSYDQQQLHTSSAKRFSQYRQMLSSIILLPLSPLVRKQEAKQEDSNTGKKRRKGIGQESASQDIYTNFKLVSRTFQYLPILTS